MYMYWHLSSKCNMMKENRTFKTLINNFLVNFSFILYVLCNLFWNMETRLQINPYALVTAGPKNAHNNSPHSASPFADSFLRFLFFSSID